MRARRRLATAIAPALAVASLLAAGVWATVAAAAVTFAVILLAGRFSALLRVVRRAEWATVPVAGAAWAAAAAAIVAAPAVHDDRLHAGAVIEHAHIGAPPGGLIEMLVGLALVSSLLALRALRRPGTLATPTSQQDMDRARAIVAAYGRDSLSPFILRPDKSFEFAGEAVVAYRVIGETAVVSSDPVGPPGACAEAMAQLMRRARAADVRVVAYGASARGLDVYRSLGLRALRAGEEAVVDPADFTLEGRRVRKLRQSVNRATRRGWRVEARAGREVDHALEREIEALEVAWHAEHRHVRGFAMSLGEFDFGVRPEDLYVLGRSPNGQLRAVMRFLACGEGLSLDTMRRRGQTPNGLNEALVCRALSYARDRGVPEVSLNYAGLAHLFRTRATAGRLVRIGLAPLRACFQMDRLVLFNEKFSPHWRPRYLVYDSRLALPRSVIRVLQAEGYLPRLTTRRSAGALAGRAGAPTGQAGHPHAEGRVR